MTATSTSRRVVLLISAISSGEKSLSWGKPGIVWDEKGSQVSSKLGPGDPDEKNRPRGVGEGVVGQLGVKGPWKLFTDRGSGVQAETESEVGARQALPILAVLKPVAVAIPQSHKLIKDDGAEEGSRVPVALQEPPRE